MLVNMDSTRMRLKHMRRDPRVSVTVMDGAAWYRQVTLFGRVAEIRDDPEFKDIDRLSLRYTRRQFEQSPANAHQRADRARSLVRLGRLDALAAALT